MIDYIETIVAAWIGWLAARHVGHTIFCRTMDEAFRRGRFRQENAERSGSAMKYAAMAAIVGAAIYLGWT